MLFIKASKIASFISNWADHNIVCIDCFYQWFPFLLNWVLNISFYHASNWADHCCMYRLLLKSHIAQKMSAHFFANILDRDSRVNQIKAMIAQKLSSLFLCNISLLVTWSKSSHEILSIKSNIALIAIKMSAQIIACIRIPSQLTQKMLKHVKIVKYCTKKWALIFCAIIVIFCM